MLRHMVSWLCSKSVRVKIWQYHGWQQEEMLFQLCKHAISYAKSEMNLFCELVRRRATSAGTLSSSNWFQMMGQTCFLSFLPGTFTSEDEC